MKRTVLLDLDGVLADFIGGVIKSLGLALDPSEWTTWDHHKQLGITDCQFWSVTEEPGWWLALDPYPWAEELVLGLCEEYEVIFCTAPSADHKCPSEKVQWLRKHRFMGRWADNYVLTRHKHLLASDRTLLIDDSPENCRRFEEHGGSALLFPQPWNASQQSFTIKRC